MDIASAQESRNIKLMAGFSHGKGVSLTFREPDIMPDDYLASRIQKGLILVSADRELAEEGTGFGVPVIKFAHETVFPGSSRITRKNKDDLSIVKIEYDLNLVKRLDVRGKRLNSAIAYKAKEFFAGLHRKYPALRRIGTWISTRLRTTFTLETRFETIYSKGTVSVIYTILTRESLVHVVAYLGGLKKDGCTEIAILNELGANFFDEYRDSSGLFLSGTAIGSWDETQASEASFIDSRDDIAFTLRRIDGAKMFRGRELVAGKLAWSGLDYVLPKGTVKFAYDIKLGGSR